MRIILPRDLIFYNIATLSYCQKPAAIIENSGHDQDHEDTKTAGDKGNPLTIPDFL